MRPLVVEGNGPARFRDVGPQPGKGIGLQLFNQGGLAQYAAQMFGWCAVVVDVPQDDLAGFWSGLLADKEPVAKLDRGQAFILAGPWGSPGKKIVASIQVSR